MYEKIRPSSNKAVGEKDDYTSGQVQTTARIVGFNKRSLFYGYAIFCTKETFDQQVLEIGSLFDYQTLRQEVGEKFFEVDANFIMTGVNETSYSMGSGLTESGHGGGGDGG